MWFAAYLCDRHVITYEQFAEAVQLQQSRKPPLGLVAIRTGQLTIREVVAVLAKQMTHPAMQFGEIAVDLGFITEQELGGLLLRQVQSTPSMSDILVEIGALTPEEVDRYQREARTAARNQEPSDVPSSALPVLLR